MAASGTPDHFLILSKPPRLVRELTGNCEDFVTAGSLPELQHVAHTNFCDIGFALDKSGRRLVIVSCLDNLGKGAAGQAVQNFNHMLGLEEHTALQ